MALEGFLSELWSGQLLTQLEKAHVLASVCNKNYEGEITAMGQLLKINMIGDITVANYAPDSTTVTPQTIGDAQKELKINQFKYFSFKVDNVRAAQMQPKIMEGAMRRAAYKLRDAADVYIGGRYGDATLKINNSGAAWSVTSLSIIEHIGLASQKLSESNVPEIGRWMVIPPWVKEKIVLAKITLDTDNSTILANGFIGKALGFDFYVSNNITIGTPSTNTNCRLLFGYDETITFAEQLLKISAYEPEAGFSEAVKGLYVYGAKVVRPETFGEYYATYSVEP